jgi:hypothetical protein
MENEWFFKKKTRCTKCGQYYDGSLYDICPHCYGRGSSRTEAVFVNSSATEAVNKTLRSNGVPPTEYTGGRQPDIRFNPTVNPAVQGGTQRVNYEDASSHRTIINGQKSTPAPVVGWLVVLEGAIKGTDFRLHTGYNYIGRDKGDICLHGDFAISSEKDTSITYLAQNRMFFVSHEQGKNPPLLNNAPVLGNGSELFPYDVITIGETRLLFIPLCGEKFSW